ncbi:Asp-tRNA(Asn)/Glu-tRNA(Gln) amidotransferase subunit GatC [Candidatus Dependentiae bacterium]|nr:Asp-tRNA(Asn)/Glu-tRNA(Gln) amidotransferase subunit GatC [Candidatus Dependentiae bacterium]
MIKITREEVLKIARISRLNIHEEEVEPLMKQLDDVLSYAQRVKEVAADIQEPSTKNMNFFREDVVIKTDPEKSLKQAPQREEDFYVVPAILEYK